MNTKSKKRKKSSSGAKAKAAHTGAAVTAEPGLFQKYGLMLFAAVLSLLVLIPMLGLDPFVRPMADDYSYAVLTRAAWLEGGSFSGLLHAAVEQLKISYATWQGTYSSIFLFALNSMVAGTRYYKFDVLLIQAVFLSGVFLLSYRLLCAGCSMTKRKAAAVSAIFISFMVVYLPGLGQGIFWRNSMIIYTFAIGLQCFAVCLMLSVYQARSTDKRLLFAAPAALLLAYLGGSNYITALCTCFGLFIACLWLFYRKQPLKRYFVFFFLISLAGLVVTVTAPGNMVRAEHFEQYDVFTTVMLSFVGAIKFMMNRFLATPLLPVSLLFAAVAAPGLRKLSFDFPRPLAVMGLSYIWFSAHFAPTIYATTSMFFEPRVMNTYFVSLSFLMVMNITYLTGWVIKRNALMGWGKDELYFALGAITVVTLIINFAGSGLKGNNLYRMYHDLTGGSASAYSLYLDDCTRELETGTAADVVLPEFTQDKLPLALHAAFLEKDPSHWMNQGVKDYYKKNSVRVE